ncbi:MAG: DUF4271 domain-containing protein [Bacteroidota bacterium]
MRPIHYSPDTTFFLQSVERPSMKYAPSIFGTHSLKVKTFTSPSHQHSPADWIAGLMLACLLILAWLQVFYFKRMRQIYRAPISQRFLNIMTREGSLFKERISLGLGFIYLFTSSFLLCMIIMDIIPGIHTKYGELLIFSFSAATLFFFWFLKVLIMRLLGIIFHTMPTTYLYFNNIMAFLFITGLLLLPMLILTVFLHSAILLYITLTISILLYILRVLRGFFIGISLKKFSYLFLFVYLCALEILPVLVMLKGLYLFCKGF